LELEKGETVVKKEGELKEKESKKESKK